MTTVKNDLICFGPVPSRRLGRSLGVNNIPPKSCTYSCIYCQLGKTESMSEKRQVFYKPDKIVKTVSEKVRELRENREKIDYLSFVPDGEPTIDKNLGEEITGLRELGIKIAVITNASLIWQDNLQKELLNADWVSVKIDSVKNEVWKQINRPHGFLRLKWIIEGIRKFASEFKGELVTETMFIRGLNDNKEDITELAKIISQLNVSKSYLAVPTRPPAENSIEPAAVETLAMAYNIFSEYNIRSEQIAGFEGTDFSTSDNAAETLLSVTAVHPMRKDAVEEVLDKTGEDWEIVKKLIEEGKLAEEIFNNKKFYIRKWEN